MLKGSRTIYSLVIVSFGWWKGRRGCHFLKNYIAAKRNAKKSELRLLKPWKMRKKANPKIYSRRYSWKHRGWFSTNLYRWRQKPLLFFSVMVRIEDFCKCEKHFHVFTVDRRFVAISTRPKKSFFLPLSAKTQIDARFNGICSSWHDLIGISRNGVIIVTGNIFHANCDWSFRIHFCFCV